MDRPFPAYKGDEPYIFVSYSHRNATSVLPELVWLNEQGFNIWYDDGIEGGSEWRGEIAQAIKSASLFVYFVTPESVQSANCLKEVNLADKQRIQILAVHLKPTTLTDSLDLTLSDRQAILKYDLSSQAYREKLLARITTFIDDSAVKPAVAKPRKAKPALIVTCLLVLVVIGAFIIAQRTDENLDGEISTEPIETTTPSQSATTDNTPAIADFPSIAVLPFVNMSSDQEQEYFSDGISEEILNLLAKIQVLKITSRSSSFFYKGKDIKITEVGRDLGVGHILEGSVRRSKNQIRITAQLINVEEDKQIWSQTWDRKLDDVFAIQDEIAAAVVVALRIRLLGELPSQARTSPQAYTLYLQAIELFNRRNADGMLKAEAMLKNVLKIDSHYLPAWIRLANVYHVGGSVGAWHPIESLPKARSAAQEVLRLDANNIPGLLVMSAIAQEYDYDYASAIVYLERAKSLSSDSNDLLLEEARLARINGDASSTLGFLEAALQRNPENTHIQYILGLSYMQFGRFNDAKVSFSRAIELSSNSSGSHFYLGAVLLLESDFEGARQHFELEVRDGYRAMGRALLYYAEGDDDQADQALKDLIALGYRWTYQIATVYAYRNEADNAFIWLDRAMDRRDTSLQGIQGDPFMSNIRDDPRLADVYKRMGIDHKGTPAKYR